jgi:hypothetical protein
LSEIKARVHVQHESDKPAEYAACK